MDSKKPTETSVKSQAVEGSKTTQPKTEETSGQKQTSNVWHIINLAVGDVLVFLIFALIGRQNHGTGKAVGVLDNIAEIVVIAAPFLIGWFLVAPFFGLYRRGLELQPRKMIQRTILAWVIAWPVGLALRGIFVDHGIPPLTFAIVTLLFNGILLLVWRGPMALARSMRR